MKNNGVQYYRVVIDRLAAGRLGLSVDDISNCCAPRWKAACSAP